MESTQDQQQDQQSEYQKLMDTLDYQNFMKKWKSEKKYIILPTLQKITFTRRSKFKKDFNLKEELLDFNFPMLEFTKSELLNFFQIALEPLVQKFKIDNQIFLIKEGMISKEQVFKKAKKFDDTGIFGIGSDEMTEEDFEEYLKLKYFTIHD